MDQRLKRLGDPRFLYLQLPWIVLSLVLAFAAVLGCVLQRPYLDAYAAGPRSVLTRFWHPIERNAHLRRLAANDPQIPQEFRADSLYSVTMSVNGQAVAVGANNILRSTDGGASWATAFARTPASLDSVTMSANGQTVVAVGGSTILRSIDGGVTWTLVATDAAVSLDSVTMSDDGQTVVTVQVRSILRSTDGATGWTPVATLTAGTLRSVTMSGNGQTIVAVGGGTILRSTNRGDDWTEITTDALLRSVTMSDDGQTVVAVGGGTILRSTDGGANWASVEGTTTESLDSVTMSANGQTVVAVGRVPTAILRSTDGGVSWEPVDGTIAGLLEAVTMSDDGQTVVTVGDFGATLRSTDGGANWAPIAYRKLPAPWIWLCFVFSFLTLRPAFKSAIPIEERGVNVADEFLSDRPIPDADADRLGYMERADTLSRFLRNENTEAPLTIAVTGDWGQGKSSLMNLVGADLKRHHTTVVSFNAWHHRRERHLFAALLQAVREQAIPPFWTHRGARFRWRLVRLRARAHPVLALLLPGLMVGALLATRSDLGALKWTSPLVILLPIFLGWKAIVADLESSAANAGRLMAAASNVFRVKQLGDQLAFRYRFMEAFKEVTEALRPHTPLILIDDLDRCKPEQVVETLEAIDFLAHAGPCYVVMGFARPQVVSCVGLGYKDIAQEMPFFSAGDDSVDEEQKQRQRRSRYAREYLRKLINIEVPVPKLTDRGALALGEPTTSSEPQLGHALRHVAKILAIWMVTIPVLGAGIYVGERLLDSASQQTLQSTDEESNATDDSAGGIPGGVPAGGGTGREETAASVDGLTRFSPGGASGAPWWSSFLPFGLLMLVGVGALIRHAWRPEEYHTRDSADFKKALQIWHPVVRARADSPRQVKRFINRVRYLSMTPSSAPIPKTRRRPVPTARLSEPLIVALAALHGLSPEAENAEVQLPSDLQSVFANPQNESREFIDWREKVLGAVAAEREPEDSAARLALRATLGECLDKAIQDHVTEEFEKAEELTAGKVKQFCKMTEAVGLH